MGIVMDHNIFASMRIRVVQALREVVPGLPEEVAARVEVTPPREDGPGDMATKAALLSADPLVEEATAAGPGFVNLRLRPEAWRGLLPSILLAGEGFGDSAIGAG